MAHVGQRPLQWALLGGLPFSTRFARSQRTASVFPGALENPDFLLFAAIASETDHPPFAHMRTQRPRS